MRLLVFLVYLFFHLLGGGQTVYANTQHNLLSATSTQSLTKKHPVKFTNKNQSSTLIEDTDLDLEEEHAGNENYEIGSANTFFKDKDKLHDKWYATHFQLFYFKKYSKDYKAFETFSGHSSPIYITQRVLRL